MGFVVNPNNIWDPTDYEPGHVQINTIDCKLNKFKLYMAKIQKNILHYTSGIISVYLYKEYLRYQLNKNFDKIEETSSEFYMGFIQHYFDFHNIVIFAKNKFSVIEPNKNKAELIQRMLLRLSIRSKIKQIVQIDLKASSQNLCKLSISGIHNLQQYQKIISFTDEERILDLISTIEKSDKSDVNFKDRIVNIIKLNKEDVYDVTVDKVHEFSGNGFHPRHVERKYLQA